MDIEMLLLAGITGAVGCAIVDFAAHAAGRRLRRRIGMTPGRSTFGPTGRIVLSLVMNLVFCGLFSYVFIAIKGTISSALVFGGLLWLTAALPTAIVSTHLDETRRGLLSIRILGWLFKMASASGAAALFIQ